MSFPIKNAWLDISLAWEVNTQELVPERDTGSHDLNMIIVASFPGLPRKKAAEQEATQCVLVDRG